MHPQTDVGVLGATGVVGQQFVRRLAAHPWFRLRCLPASERSEGRRYRDVVSWRWPAPIPRDIVDLIVAGSSTAAGAPRVLFSALDASVRTRVPVANGHTAVKFVALGDNLVRGAAGAAILNAELLAAEGRLS